MSYSITLWSFTKKTNSTKQPTATGTSFTCDILDGSGILNPTVKLHTSFVDPSAYNYAKISAWNRYYFVSNWRYDRGLWWADLAEDVLASWKTDIGNFTGYVLRSASASNGNIKDTLYPAKATPTRTTKVMNIGWYDELSDGYFVVGVINGDTSALGSVSYYVMTPAQFNAFCHAVYNNTNDWLDAANITDISTELLKTLFNPFEYVVSCMWFPIGVPVVPGVTVNSIPLGWWSVPVSATGVLYSEAVTALTYAVAPDQHPQAATRGNFLNSGPYTNLTLTFQPFGTIPLDASLVCGNTIELTVYTDYISGVSCLYVQVAASGNDGTFLGSYATQLGVPVQISGRQPNIASMIAGATAAFVDALPQSDVVQDIKHVAQNLLGAPETDIRGAISGVASAISTGCKRLTSTGSNGSRAQILPEAYLSHDFLLLTDESLADFGRPLYENRKISNLSGYIKMGEAHVSMAGLEQEKTMVSGYLLSGFFYE